MSGSLNISIANDTVQEYNETFDVLLQLQSKSECLPITLTGDKNFTITIIDDEGYSKFCNYYVIHKIIITHTELTVEFSQTMYSGREASGDIIVTLNLLGGTANKSFDVTISTSQVSATGKHKHVLYLWYILCVGTN